MKIIHETGYNSDDCLHYRPVVYSNTIQVIFFLLTYIVMQTYCALLFKNYYHNIGAFLSVFEIWQLAAKHYICFISTPLQGVLQVVYEMKISSKSVYRQALKEQHVHSQLKSRGTLHVIMQDHVQFYMITSSLHWNQ